MPWTVSFHLAALVQPLPHYEVDHEPGEAETGHQLPLHGAQPSLQPGVGHQHAVADNIKGVDTPTFNVDYLQYSSTGVVFTASSVSLPATCRVSELLLKSMQN